MRRYLVVFLLTLGACGAPAEPTLRFSEVASSVEADIIGAADIYISVSIGDLEVGDSTWALQRLELRMTARDGSTTIHLPTGSYVLDDTSITSADDNARSITLFPEDRLEIIVRIGPDQPLRPGIHLVSFELPATENREGGRPVDGRLTISIRHRVADPARREQTGAFCDEAVPLVDSRIPSREDLNVVMASAERNLTEAQSGEISHHARQLADDVDAFNANAYNGVGTSEIVGVIGEMCQVEMFAVAAAA